MRWSLRVADAQPLDSDWLRAHPLPRPDNAADKNARGRVLAIGGCALVPGGIALTAEAAFRAGAGKVQVATIERAALALGVAMPEIAVIGLTENADGEIEGEAFRPLLARCDAVIAGPAMGCEKAAGRMTDAVLGACSDALVILDAAALMSARNRRAALQGRKVPAILTPHLGEMAALLGRSADEIDADRARATLAAAEQFGAVVVLKGATSLIATREGELFAYAGGGVGLATGGSGDVLAGITAGLAARGADPLAAALWSVWLHGEAGRRCAEQLGPIGFLARELLAHVPALLRAL